MGLEELLANLSDRSDRRGKEFERICQWYLRSAPEYRAQVQHVWLWDEWPERWAADAGIDLVAEMVGGDLWAIQAKAYDPAYTIKKTDVDSFLSESARAQFSYRLLIATTDRVGPTARRTLAGQEKPAGLLLRSQLEVADLNWPESPADLKPRAQVRKHARPHQRKAVNEVVAGFRAADRGQLVMACGTGKTLAACFLAQELTARRVLVLVPSLSLLAQTLREWGAAADFSYLAVCSDESVANGETDAVVASISELGIPVTTDPVLIARFLGRHDDAMCVVFATYQSSRRVAEAQVNRPPFDLVIADEAHRCSGPKAGVFGTVLDETQIKAAKRLFMTATPRYFTGRVRKEASEADWEVASMDDKSQFGPVFHRLSFADAVEQDLLSDYQVAVVGVSDATYREYAERGVFITADGEATADARTLASQLGLLRAMKNYGLRRVVTFHSRVRSASAFARSLPNVCEWLPLDRRPDGPIWADHVSGRMSSGERDVRLNRLRAVEGEQRGVLSNARCLAEGVDVPTLDGVAFIEPRRSQIDVVQAVGRAMRKAENKTLGTVVIPVFVDETGDPELALDTSDFRNVWEVVKALRAHDDVLAEELDELRRDLGRRTRRIRLPEKIHVDLPVGVSDAFARAFDTRLVELTTSRWEEGISSLERFSAREGHSRVAAEYLDENGLRLGRWVREQRDAFVKHPERLTDVRRERLESIPGWTWTTGVKRAKKRSWEQSFANLLRYVEREGHARVPPSHVENGQRLGLWVSAQRVDRNSHNSRMTPERAARLEMVAGWTWRAQEEDLEKLFRALERFAAREGHTRVPTKHVEDGLSLGQWVTNQRYNYRTKAPWMTSNRIARLEAVTGWTWSPRARLGWDDHYRSLRRFAEREGHTRVPQEHVEDGNRWLAAWVATQRRDYTRRALRMTPERIATLETLPGWSWDGSANADAWETWFSRLLSFVEREGHARVPQNVDIDGFQLGPWVSTQRIARRKGKMPVDRAARLESLPGWVWDIRKKASDASNR